MLTVIAAPVYDAIDSSRLLKNAHLRRCPYPSLLRRTSKYASLLGISGALHLGIFEQSAEKTFSATAKILIVNRGWKFSDSKYTGHDRMSTRNQAGNQAEKKPQDILLPHTE
jgi:hypothetical protein